jgi:hypothetical protein
VLGDLPALVTTYLCFPHYRCCAAFRAVTQQIALIRSIGIITLLTVTYQEHANQFNLTLQIMINL